MASLPLPCRADNLPQVRMLGFPAEVALGFLGGGDELGGVAGAAGLADGGNRMAGDLARGFDHLTDRETAPVAEVEGGALGAALQELEGQHVRRRQVVDV